MWKEEQLVQIEKTNQVKVFWPVILIFWSNIHKMAKKRLIVFISCISAVFLFCLKCINHVVSCFLIAILLSYWPLSFLFCLVEFCVRAVWSDMCLNFVNLRWTNFSYQCTFFTGFELISISGIWLHCLIFCLLVIAFPVSVASKVMSYLAVQSLISWNI